MNRNHYDVIVLGVGAMGASTCYHLARRGARVLGLERFGVPHAFGGSHGFSRMIRLAYYEHPDYVTLLRRSFDLWDELEAETGQKLLHLTGGLYIGRADCDLVAGSKQAADQHGIEYETLDHGALQREAPAFHLPEQYVGFREAKAGFLVPELTIAASAAAAMRRGAEIHGHETVLDFSSSGSEVEVRTDRATYRADRVIVSGGAWTNRLITDLGVTLSVTRQIMAWTWPRVPERFELGRLPCWAVDSAEPGEPFRGIHYGFPMMPDNPGFKIALHYPATPVDPDQVSRTPTEEDERTVMPFVRDVIPEADGPLLAIRTCLYTNSPDSHFIVDHHPEQDRIVIACGFSGHGFKFASVIGEALADLALNGRSDLPIGFLGLSRFA